MREVAILLQPVVLLAATGCPSSPTPSATGRTTMAAASDVPSASVVVHSSASASVAVVPASAPCASSLPGPPDDSRDNPWCAPRQSMGYGDWRPRPDEVLAAIAVIKHSGGAGGWLVGMVRDCMQRIGHPYIEVMSGVMYGDRATPDASLLATGSVEWNGRRFITLSNQARIQATFISTTDAVELTSRGPVQVIETCQQDPRSTAGPSGPRVTLPRGWSTFPEEVRKLLCP